MSYVIGQILADGTIQKDFGGQGYIYKNHDAFDNKTDEVCYVPEHSGDGMDTHEVNDDSKYTYKDFVRIAQEFIDENEDVKAYCEQEETTAEDIAKNIFEMVDWQCPETLVEGWVVSGAYTIDEEE